MQKLADQLLHFYTEHTLRIKIKYVDLFDHKITEHRRTQDIILAKNLIKPLLPVFEVIYVAAKRIYRGMHFPGAISVK